MGLGDFLRGDLSPALHDRPFEASWDTTTTMLKLLAYLEA
jgi:hypothetical protein